MKTENDKRFVTIDQHLTTAVLKSRIRATCAISSADADSGACDTNVSTSLALAEVDGVTGSASEADARLLAE